MFQVRCNGFRPAVVCCRFAGEAVWHPDGEWRAGRRPHRDHQHRLGDDSRQRCQPGVLRVGDRPVRSPQVNIPPPPPNLISRSPSRCRQSSMVMFQASSSWPILYGQWEAALHAAQRAQWLCFRPALVVLLLSMVNEKQPFTLPTELSGCVSGQL